MDQAGSSEGPPTRDRQDACAMSMLVVVLLNNDTFLRNRFRNFLGKDGEGNKVDLYITWATKPGHRRACCRPQCGEVNK
ncbi:hypothetical protein CYMTET_56468 [Cymbomonas tetramitiformis]|uniref:Uncharacterized protein n=1 Tax=Cymbomonas tetramitiformis TaxID=36881 RepID=A0AAE0ENQ2_9CHLO|nr:hypothetical protein CYMTET_56468 [Cymbomonas tetramitiformis]